MGSNKEWYYKERMSEECACGKTKRAGYAFCWYCYQDLPPNLQARLYDRIGRGYEEAYDEAFKELEL